MGRILGLAFGWKLMALAYGSLTTFDTAEEFRKALIEFRNTYNEEWLIERHGHRSPALFRHDQMDSQPVVA